MCAAGRVSRAVLKPETEIGFHGHNNLGMGIANSLVAIEEGASRIDASAPAPLEVFAAVCERMGIVTGVNLFKLMDVAEHDRADDGPHGPRETGAADAGFRGVYSTFLLHCERAAQRYGVPARDILVELAARTEDMILDTAMTMARERGLLQVSPGLSEV